MANGQAMSEFVLIMAALVALGLLIGWKMGAFGNGGAIMTMQATADTKIGKD